MNKDTNKIEDINFGDFMASKGSDNIDDFFGTLSDLGVPVSISGEEFCADKDALDNADMLGCNLVFYGNWMIAKVTAFEALRTLGFEAIKSASDCCEYMDVGHEYGGGSFKGEWCLNNGVVYASYCGNIEVAHASQEKLKRNRYQADLKTAECLLSSLFGQFNEGRKVT